MTKKWNLQDIRPAEPRKPRTARPVVNSAEPSVRPRYEEKEDIPSIVIEDGKKRESGRLIISIIIFFIIVGGAIGLSAIMGKTVLTIYPENRTPNISAEFTAYPDKRDGELSYEIMTLETTGESQVKASGQIQVQQQAIGSIEIIKTTPGTERLIKNTRFRSKDGLIFRIQESVVVPGAVRDSTGTSIPGTIRSEVFSDEPGEDYNLASGTTFDIPGFQENGFTELYNSITARADGPFSGGYNGPQFQIDEGELATARQALQIKLRDGLLERVGSEKPSNFIAFNDAVAITYNQLPAVEYGQDLVTIREQAILQIPLFQGTEFGSFLAKETIPTYDRGPVRVDDINSLNFQYTDPTISSSVIANEPSLTFRLTGKLLLIWEYDDKKLASDLAGLPKTAINNIITSYSGINSAIVSITPFWKRTFPDMPEDIIFKEEIKEN